MAAGFFVGGAAFMIGVMTVTGAVVSLIWTIKIDAHGIGASTFIGWPKRVTWGAIESVRFEAISGIPYFVMKARGHWLHLYLPAELREPERFETLVLEYAGEEHLLSDWFAPLDASDEAAL